MWEDFIVAALAAGAVDEAISGAGELHRAEPKWCNCPLLLDILEHTPKSQIERLAEVLDGIGETADAKWDFCSIQGDVFRALSESAPPKACAARQVQNS